MSPEYDPQEGIMYLLVVVLPQENLINELLTKFLEIDVRGATIIDSYGMGEILSQEIPIFSSLRNFLSGEGNKIHNQTLFSVIKTEDTLKLALNTAKQIIDFSKPNSDILFVVPIIEMIGLADPLDQVNPNDNQ